MGGRRSLQERLEATGAGRVLISLGLLFTLLAVVVTNLPDSHLRRTLSERTQPYLNATGLDQNWGVFAPDPRREVLGLEARAEYRDQTIEVWKPPVRGALIGGYSDYRWQKLMEAAVVEEPPRPGLRRAMSEWVARTQRGRAELPLSVTLFRLSSELKPPGGGAGEEEPLSDVKIHEFRLPLDWLDG